MIMEFKVDDETGEVLNRNFTLPDRIEQAVNEEYARALAAHGLNHSTHESFALILEEYDEAIEELKRVKKNLDSAWMQVRDNNPEAFSVITDQIKGTSMLAAAECVRIAVTAIKASESI